MLIEVYALSDLKKIIERTAINSDKKVTQVFDSHNLQHESWIQPLKKRAFYKGKQEYQFSLGNLEDLDLWRRGICSLIHEQSLEEFISRKDEEAALYPLLTCSPVDTAFGPVICERIYNELVAGWKYIIHLQEDNLDEVIFFSELYLKWTRCFALGRKNGIVELF